MSSGYFGQSDQMEHRDLGRELSNIGKSSEPLLGLMRDQAQQQGRDQLALAGEFSDAALQLYPELAGAERTATTLQRGQDRRDLERLGPKYRASLGAIAPEWQRALGALDSEVGRAGDSSPLSLSLNDEAMSRGPSALRTELEQQAQEDLALGGDLSPSEIRAATQQARAGASARGLASSNPAIAAEVLARDYYGRQRQDARRAFAGGVQALALGEDQANRGFGLNVEAQNEAHLGNERNFLQGAAGVQQNALSPVLGFFGRSGVSPTAGAGVLAAAPNIIGAGQSAVGPLLGYGSDLYNTNFNSDASTKLNNASNMAAIHGAVIGAVGSLAGAGMCWVAREIFGRELVDIDGTYFPKWMVFREWVQFRAPRLFRKVYMRFGERFAKWLRNKPKVKARLRPWFEQTVYHEVDRLMMMKPLQNGAVSMTLQHRGAT